MSYLHGKDETKGPHHHPVDETLYLMRGAITFTIAGDRYELQRATNSRCPPERLMRSLSRLNRLCDGLE